MSIRFLNCFTTCARWPTDWETGTLCLLVETRQGLVLVDTGMGTQDYLHPTLITRIFRVLTKMPFDQQEAAINQVQQAGYQPGDVSHIVLTHMHFDHCGGLADFPNARVHILRKEYEAFKSRPHSFFDLAYVRRHIAHQPEITLYDDYGESWFDFKAVRLPFEPEMWLLPLPYHTRGHCGVAIRNGAGWHLHCGDAAGDFSKDLPAWAIRLVLGPHEPRLRAFGQAHPEVQLTSSHMFLDYFESGLAQ
jgi:glyoxylase-like metal-dependent hydrolase (beta-lactamase superfamily II)